MRDLLLRVLGWRLLLFHSDSLVFDRWLWVRRHLTKGPVRTFDAGCGNGVFSMYAARCGNSVVAASFSSDEQEIAQARAEQLGIDGIDFRLLDLRELESQRTSLGKFDQVICLETVEHVLDDRALMCALALMLDPGGQLLLTTPSARHRPLYGEVAHPSSVEDGSHVRFGYSPQQVAQLAEAAGLEVLEQSFVSGLIAQKLTNLLWRLTKHLGLAPAWMLLLPLRPLVALDGPFTRISHYPHLCLTLRAVSPSGPAR